MNEKNHWRSLRDLQDAEAMEERKSREFEPGVTDAFDPAELSPLSRKQFLALMAASAAFAAAGCTNYRDKGEIVPYSKKPEDITPGRPLFYASTCTGCKQSCGTLIKTREGRPIKVDGNPDHPVNRGRLCATGQATLLQMYDPARLRGPRTGAAAARSGDVSWDQVDTEAVQQLAACIRDGKQIVLVTGPQTSPSARKVVSDFKAAFPSTRVLTYDRLHEDARRHGWERAYGPGAVPSIQWDKAHVIVTLEADVLGTDGAVVEQTAAFAAGRDIDKPEAFIRLYAIEGAMSLTGTNADYRLRLSPALQLEFVLALIREVAGKLNLKMTQLPVGRGLHAMASASGIAASTVDLLVQDLIAARGKGIVYAGAAHGDDMHAAVNVLNEILGNTALYGAPIAGEAAAVSSVGDFSSLIADMKAGKVGFIAHLDVNPVYHLPAVLGYSAALAKVPFSVAMVEAENETAVACTYMLPIHSMFESWGDHSVREGVLSLQQPVVAPLYATRQKEAILLHWMGASGPFNESAYRDHLKKYWETTVYPAAGVATDFTAFWQSSLHDGVIALARPAASRPAMRGDVLASVTVPAPAAATVLVTAAQFIGDGKFANNGWLQELPDPVTKIVWDNYAALAPATAKRLGVKSDDLIEVTTAAGKVTLPVFEQPGTAEDVVAVALGYGRTTAGPVGSGTGVDVAPILPASLLTGSRILPALTVAKAEGHYALASTQEHHSLDDTFVKDFHLKRHIIQEGTLEEYKRDPHAVEIERKEYDSISPRVTYEGLKWGMAIDLNKCTGCNACVAGCNVENNIPVVGREQVAKGREMQWIRIDRYFSGTPEDPVASHQPMLCQHCDNAPCENVCPVVATNHSPDGINQMIYNRCVGTKYCSNNCPYKVRRFNFFNFRDHLADGYQTEEPFNLMHNPEVTVRSRGVMEKCSFCVQRIMDARQLATEQGRTINGADVQTACQQACPASAIEFGNVLDPASRVAKLREHHLGYDVLGELNVRPNVTYVARLRNIHSEKSA
jgi:Fe-S-cluster-containing dehydrogenase component/anaerobic selenocysteine-containing dehydrogenase